MFKSLRKFIEKKMPGRHHAAQPAEQPSAEQGQQEPSVTITPATDEQRPIEETAVHTETGLMPESQTTTTTTQTTQTGWTEAPTYQQPLEGGIGYPVESEPGRVNLIPFDPFPASKGQFYPYDSSYDDRVVLSTCTGNKKALLIGINYSDTQSELKGCINDVQRTRDFLIRNFAFSPQSILVLTDDQKDPMLIPTRANIIQGIRWLLEGVQQGDSLFLHYSGHGGTAKDLVGEELSGFNQTIVPVDYTENGQIIDDELHELLVKPLPSGVRLTSLFDSCHSGTVLDLPYTYKTGQEQLVYERDNKREAMERFKRAGIELAEGDIHQVITELARSVESLLPARQLAAKALHKKLESVNSTIADVIELAGCRDEQTSADTVIAGKATGAMSWAFIEVLERNRNITYGELLTEIQNLLRPQYSQVPQLSAGYKANVNNQFLL